MTIADNKTFGYGVAGSLAVHVLLFCILALMMGAPSEMLKVVPEPEKEVQVVFAENLIPEPAPPPEKTDSQRYIRTTQNEKQIDSPSKADFVSDRNTVASAKLPAAPDGDQPLPSMKGINAPTLELTNRNYKEGELKNDSAPAAPPMKPAASPEKQDSPPQKKAGETAPKTTQGEGEEHLPLDVKKADSPPRAIPMPSMKAPNEDAPPTPPAPPAPPVPNPEKDAFVPETRTANVKGSISNQGGEDAVNARETMEGRYMRQVHEAVGVKWHKLYAAKRDFANPGIFSIHFFIAADGSVKPEDINVHSNHNNVVIESVAIQSIREAKIPPIPAELLKVLDHGRFPAVMNFLIGQ